MDALVSSLLDETSEGERETAWQETSDAHGSRLLSVQCGPIPAG